MFITSNQVHLEIADPESINNSWIETLNDKEYMKFSENRFQHWTYETQVRYLNQFNQFQSWCLKIIEMKNKSFVGTLTIKFDFIDRTINIGILIFKEFQGLKYATYALKLVCSYINENFPNFTIEMGTHNSNFPMIKVIKNEKFELVQQNKYSEKMYFTKKCDSLNDSTRTSIPLLILWAKKIGIVANDAGGAEQLKWLSNEVSGCLNTFLQGPAVKIFKEKGSNLNEFENIEQLLSCDLVLIGSGWMSDFENRAIEFCILNMIPFIILLDHWDNYGSRFQSLPKSQLKLLAVTNQMAYRQAKKNFANSSIWHLPDLQIADYLNTLKYEKTGQNILMVLEPASSFSNAHSISIELIFDLLKKSLQINRVRKLDGIIVRLHPSQDINSNEFDYFKSLSKEFSISKNSELIDDLKLSRIVVGFSSYALYIASMCGIETFSYFKGSDGHWTNHFKNISPVTII